MNCITFCYNNKEAEGFALAVSIWGVGKGGKESYFRSVMERDRELIIKEAVRVMLPVVRLLSGGDRRVSRIIWRQYFEDRNGFVKAGVEERVRKMRVFLGGVLGCEVPEEVRRGFWDDRQELVEEVLTNLPKVRGS